MNKINYRLTHSLTEVVCNHTPNKKKLSGSAFFNFSRRATRDAARMEIQKYDQRTDGRTDRQTWVGATDTCVSKNY